MAKKEIPYGALRQRNNGRWHWRYYDRATGKHVQRACIPEGDNRATRNKATARALVRLWAAQRPSVDQADLVDLFERYASSKASVAHARDYRRKVEKFLATGIRPEEITAKSLIGYVSTLDGQPSTVRNHLSAISRFCGFLVIQGVLDENPASRVDFPKIPKTHPAFVPREQEYALRRVALEVGIYHEVTFALYTGLRRGELAALRWGDIEADRLHVRKAKGQRPRTIPMPAKLRRTIARTMTRGRRDDLVFRKRGLRQWDDAIRPLADCGEFPDFRYEVGQRKRRGWHILRHTFCTWLASAGVPLPKIKEWAGHASITTTMQYVHMVPGYDGDIDRL